MSDAVSAAAAAGGPAAVSGSGTTTPRPARRQFEYVTAPLLVHNTKVILDNWGEDGWELVQVVPGPGPEQLVAYFKREKQ